MTSLCQLAGDYRGQLMPAHGSLVEPKIDGWRCLYIPGHDGKPALWTRQGMPLMGAGHVLKRLVEIDRAMGGGHVIDGEFQVDGTLAATKAHCERGWRDGDRGTFHAFDCMPWRSWDRGGTDTPLYQRKLLLQGAIEGTAPDPWEWEEGSRGRGHGQPCVVLMPERWVSDAADLRSYADEIWRAGGEGVMMKDAESCYSRRRTNAWLKVKSPGQFRP